MRTIPSIVALAVLCAPTAGRAQLTEDCVGQPTIDANDVLPLTFVIDPASTDFDLTGPGCEGGAEGGHLDAVVCFTTENTCTMSVFLSGPDPNPGITIIAINQFEGPCTSTPTCVDRAVADSPGVSLDDPVFTGGVQTCLIVSTTDPQELTLSLSEAGSSPCGTLPAELLDWSIE